MIPRRIVEPRGYTGLHGGCFVRGNTDMPDQPTTPPLPDAFRQSRPAPPQPKIDILNDPFNPDPAKAPPLSLVREKPEEKEEAEKPVSGLAEFDPAHAFAGVLASGFGRAAAVVVTCMLAFGLTEACHRVSLIFDGWRAGGFSGFFGAIFAIPGAVFVSPGRWFTALGQGITDPFGVPYLMLAVGGLILAVRSEINIVKLLLFYALVSGIHAAAFFKMKNPISVLLWLGVMVGFVWLYRWYWRQQVQVEEIQIEEEPPADES
jgi:hypothetical protein